MAQSRPIPFDLNAWLEPPKNDVYIFWPNVRQVHVYMRPATSLKSPDAQINWFVSAMGIPRYPKDFHGIRLITFPPTVQRIPMVREVCLVLSLYLPPTPDFDGAKFRFFSDRDEAQGVTNIFVFADDEPSTSQASGVVLGPVGTGAKRTNPDDDPDRNDY